MQRMIQFAMVADLALPLPVGIISFFLSVDKAPFYWALSLIKPNIARHIPGNTKILYFFNCLLDGSHTTGTGGFSM